MAGNVLIGGLTAATRAALGRKNVWRAFGLGAVGGVVHVAGKNLAVEPGAPKAWLGLAIASTGTSMVSNAGRGVSLLDEVTLPITAARVRFTIRDAKKVRVALNGFESILVASAFFTDDLQINWARTAESGVFVFETTGARINVSDEFAGGLAWGPVTIIAEDAYDADRTQRHEVVHVYQSWFVSEAWGRPLENAFLRRTRLRRVVPSWLELGLTSEALMMADYWLGRGLRSMKEAEASRLERR